MRLQKDSNNSHTLWANNGIFYFSYETCVAFRDDSGLHVSVNVWGKTTGRHLNEIDDGDKANRLPHDEFVLKLAKVQG